LGARKKAVWLNCDTDPETASSHSANGLPHRAQDSQKRCGNDGSKTDVTSTTIGYLPPTGGGTARP